MNCPPCIEPEELREALLRLLQSPDLDAVIAAVLLIVDNGLVKQSNGGAAARLRPTHQIVTPLPPSVPFPTGHN